MTIAVKCQCGKKFQVKEEFAGKRAKCKACGHILVVPQPPDAEEAPNDRAVTPIVAGPAPDVFPPEGLVRFPPRLGLVIPPVCCGCLAPAPSGRLIVNVLAAKSPTTPAKPGKGNTVGRTAGSIAGGVIGGLLFGGLGSVVGSAIGESMAANSGPEAKPAADEAPFYSLPLCDACEKDLSPAHRQALGANTADGRADTPLLARSLVPGKVTFHFRQAEFAKALFHANRDCASHGPESLHPAHPSLHPPRDAAAPKMLIEARATSDEHLQALLEKLLPHNPGSRIWLRPEIPPKKLANAIATYAKDVDPEDVLALIDDTMFGTGSEGLLMTAAGLFIHTTYEKGQWSWPLLELASAEGGFPSYRIVLKPRAGDVRKFSCSSFNDLRPKVIEVINQMVLYAGRTP